MMTRIAPFVALSLSLCVFAGTASAQTWSPEQQEVWKVEKQQWAASAANDLTWMDTMVHPNLKYWQTGDPMPRDKASLKQWGRLEGEDGKVREHEIFPISVTITGNVAVAQYYYMMARQDYKNDRENVTGHYTDVLVKENGHWLFLAWAGGDDPKK